MSEQETHRFLWCFMGMWWWGPTRQENM